MPAERERLYHLYVCLFVGDWVLLGSTGWPGTHNPPALPQSSGFVSFSSLLKLTIASTRINIFLY
jgi:hypothetical protein